MRWFTLFKRIGKQPLKVTQNTDVILLTSKGEVKLTLRYQNNKPFLIAESKQELTPELAILFSENETR